MADKLDEDFEAALAAKYADPAKNESTNKTGSKRVLKTAVVERAATTKERPEEETDGYTLLPVLGRDAVWVWGLHGFEYIEDAAVA